MKLNLGCGNRHEVGYVNVDVNPAHKPDQVWNLDEFPYPWSDESIDEIKMRGVLEHVDSVIVTMDEVWRILKFNHRVYIEVPYVTHFQAIGHPQHKHFFHCGTFGWLDMHSRTKPGMERYTDRYFQVVKNQLVFEDRLKMYEEMFNAFPRVYNSSFLSKLIPASVLNVVLEKVR